MDSTAEKLTVVFGAGEDRIPKPYNRAASTFDGQDATTSFRLEATGTLGTTEVCRLFERRCGKLTSCADGFPERARCSRVFRVHIRREEYVRRFTKMPRLSLTDYHPATNSRTFSSRRKRWSLRPKWSVACYARSVCSLTALLCAVDPNSGRRTRFFPISDPALETGSRRYRTQGRVCRVSRASFRDPLSTLAHDSRDSDCSALLKGKLDFPIGASLLLCN